MGKYQRFPIRFLPPPTCPASPIKSTSTGVAHLLQLINPVHSVTVDKPGFINREKEMAALSSILA